MSVCELCCLSDDDKKYFLCGDHCWDVYLADKQNYIGRCIIICKRHCSEISELSDDEWLSLRTLVVKLENAVKDAFGADMFNFSCLMNDEYKKSEPNPHLHFHLIPRYSKTVKIGNKQFTDNEWAHHYNNKAPMQIAKSDITIVFETIKKCLYNQKFD